MEVFEIGAVVVACFECVPVFVSPVSVLAYSDVFDEGVPVGTFLWVGDGYGQFERPLRGVDYAMVSVTLLLVGLVDDE